MLSNIKIILVDENIPFRQALKAILVKEFNASIIGELESINDLQQIQNYSVADIILLDLVLPEINGIKQTINVLKQDSAIKIIALTSYNESIYHNNLLESGFVGCIYKDELFNQLSSELKKITRKN